MGLDMFLYKKTFLDDDSKSKIKEALKKTGRGEPATLYEEVAYWRKCNQVHRFMLEGREDNCEPKSVSKERLIELHKICKELMDNIELKDGKIQNGYTVHPNGKTVYNFIDGKIIKNKALAKKLLPTMEGFFFGSTEYDEYYMQDVELTYKMLDEIIRADDFDDPRVSFSYECSW